MTKRRENVEAPSQDSFLDIVANLVGILIILVMVVGARAKVAWVDAATSEEAESKLSDLRASVAAARDEAKSLEMDNNQLDAKIKIQEASIQARRAERDHLQILATAAKRELDQQREKLDESVQQQLKSQQDLRAAEEQLKRLNQQHTIAENASAPVTVIEHLPTPMAKTVFGQEVHFRLKAGRVTYVPMDELVDKMKGEIQVKAEKLRQAPQTVETVGPIGGFHLQYQLSLVVESQQTQIGPIQNKYPRFDGFNLIPIREPLGETLEQAMRGGSQFRQIIDGLNPEANTITMWVYPDSFDQFRVLKRELFERGFLTASWPLPAGFPISGGPNGRRSAAQ